MKIAHLAWALALLGAVDAHAYVRTRSSLGSPGTPSYWPGGCVFVQPATIDADTAATIGLTPDAVYDVVKRSLADWNDATASCSYLKLNYDEPTDAEAHYDGRNVIKFRTDQWCHPEDGQNHGVCYSPQAAAITSVFMINDGEDKDGLILDADVELNNLNFTFFDAVPGMTMTARPGTALADLENTLTHELGHLLGLSHTCKDTAWFHNDVDENGNAPPDCSTLKQLPEADRNKITTATMYNFATPGETAKRSPEADDVAGVCNAYPASGNVDDRPDKDSCRHTDLGHYTQRGGCDFNPHSLPAGVPLVLLVVALVARRRRPLV